MQTIVALYDDISSARDAVRELTDIGVLRENISLVANDVNNRYARYVNPESVDAHTEDHVTGSEGAGFGAVVGGLTGLLAGLGAFVIPGIGPVIGAGPLIAALTGATTGVVAGTITGGIVGSLIHAGVPETEAHLYAEGVRRGSSLVSVLIPDDMATRVEEVLNRHQPVNVDNRIAYWRKEGWDRFDEAAQPYTDTDVSNFHARYRAPAPDVDDTQPVRHARRYDSDRPAKV
jgi:hypothetical protein